MPPTSPTALAAARRVLAQASEMRGPGDAGRDPVAVGEWVSRVLADTLLRWFGPYGYYTLLTRALAQAREAHPAVAAIEVRGPSDPTLTGLADAAAAHGTSTIADGIAAIISAVIELLGQLTGEDMAVTLVEQAVLNSAPRVERIQSEESHS